MLWHPSTPTTLERDETGVTALEYGLVAAFIAMAILAAVTSLDNKLGAVFSGLADFFAANGR